MEMKAHTVANVVLISIAPTPNMFHHNNVGVTYARTSNFKVEQIPLYFVPLYFVLMPHFMVTIIKAPFTTTSTHTVAGMRSRPWTSRGTNL